MNYLLEQGKIAIRIRKHLREFLAAQPEKNNFINDLLEKEYKDTRLPATKIADGLNQIQKDSK